LSKVWAEDSFAEILGNKVLYVNSENNCTTYRALNGVMYTEEAYHLYCSHEEADTRMFFHVSTLPRNTNVVVRTSDTDCLVIGLASVEKFPDNCNVWLEVGIQSKNTQRYISLNNCTMNWEISYAALYLAIMHSRDVTTQLPSANEAKHVLSMF